MAAELMMACTSDFSGLVRGKGFRATDLDRKVARGIGWTPTNVQITCFDTIAESPYGALGDLVLRPDPGTLVAAPLPGGGSLRFLLGDITELDGSPWECCTRSLLKTALARFRAVSGLDLRATFEHEFMLPGGSGTRAFTLQGFAERQRFGEALFDALDGAGIAPDSFLREYGPDQMEITLPPAPALRAADEAVIVREVTRATAAAMGFHATFSPLCAPDIVGNGVHIHLSLWDGERPVTHDPAGQDGLSAQASAFIAGVLAHLNAVSASPRRVPSPACASSPTAGVLPSTTWAGRTARPGSASARSPRPIPQTARASSTWSSAPPTPPLPRTWHSLRWWRREPSDWRQDLRLRRRRRRT
jgi:glutamine synthetase